MSTVMINYNYNEANVLSWNIHLDVPFTQNTKKLANVECFVVAYNVIL